LTYKADYILATLAIFTVFEVLSLLAQGKIVRFTACTGWYGGGIAALNVLLGIYLFVLHKLTTRLMAG
jgi:hypothetical protein